MRILNWLIDAIKAHIGGVTKIQWLEKSGILITGGKDKKISVRRESF